jgi:hypothetical protein
MIRNGLLLISFCVFVLYGYVSFVEPLRLKIVGSDAYPGSIASVVVSENELMDTKESMRGTVQVIQEPTGEEYIRFYNFTRKKTFPGCRDVRLMLTNTFSREGALDIGGFNITSGEVNYTVPNNALNGEYTHAMIWCQSFRTSYGIVEIFNKEKISIIK